MNITATSSSLAASSFTLADLERTVAMLEAMPTAVLSCPSEQSARSEARRLQSEYDRDNRLRLAFRSENEDTGK